MLANRTARCEADAQCAYGIRYDAYRSADWIDEHPHRVFTDRFDATANSRTHLLFKGERPVGTVRTTVWTGGPGWDDVPCLHVFGPRLLDHVGGGRERFVELSRFAIAPDLTHGVREAQLALFNNAVHAADAYGCRYMVAAVRTSHAAFYRRMYFEERSEAVPYPGLRFCTHLMVMDWRYARPLLYADSLFGRVFRYPRIVPASPDAGCDAEPAPIPIVVAAAPEHRRMRPGSFFSRLSGGEGMSPAADERLR